MRDVRRGQARRWGASAVTLVSLAEHMVDTVYSYSAVPIFRSGSKRSNNYARRRVALRAVFSSTFPLLREGKSLEISTDGGETLTTETRELDKLRYAPRTMTPVSGTENTARTLLDECSGKLLEEETRNRRRVFSVREIIGAFECRSLTDTYGIRGSRERVVER